MVIEEVQETEDLRRPHPDPPLKERELWAFLNFLRVLRTGSFRIGRLCIWIDVQILTVFVEYARFYKICDIALGGFIGDAQFQRFSQITLAIEAVGQSIKKSFLPAFRF